jgi:hypothetical protein
MKITRFFAVFLLFSFVLLACAPAKPTVESAREALMEEDVPVAEDAPMEEAPAELSGETIVEAEAYAEEPMAAEAEYAGSDTALLVESAEEGVAKSPDSDGLDAPVEQTIQSGTLTAGDIDDNLNFNFFYQYLNYMKEIGIWQSTGFADLSYRVTLQFLDENDQPLGNLWVSISLEGANQPLIESLTAANGTFYFFPKLDGAGDATLFNIQVWSVDQDTLLTTVLMDIELLSGERKMDIVVPSAQKQLPNALDLMLVIDTTGSMVDELNYLITELRSIVGAVQREHPGLSIRFGLVVYRDHGDEYIVRDFGFTQSLEEMQARLSEQIADGGGDYPEAMDEALAAALNAGWRSGNTARMLFRVADAPPHAEKMQSTFGLAEVARQKDITIVPVAASGVADEAEFLMRQAAVITQGRYVFLTDDSGVGNTHAEPKVACYVVTLLDGLLARVISAELSGERVEAGENQIIRRTGNYEAGICSMNEQ